MVRINLLPVRVSKKKEAGKQQLVLFVVLLVGGIVGNVLWTQSRASELKKREKAVAEMTAKAANLDKIIGEVNSLKAEEQELEQKLKVLDTLKAARTGPVRMLDALTEITPRRLWLRKLDEKGGKVTFEGTAASNFEISQFMEGLGSSKYFEGVELKKTQARAEKDAHVVDFTVTAVGKYAPTVEPAADAKGGKPAKPGAKAGG